MTRLGIMWGVSGFGNTLQAERALIRIYCSSLFCRRGPRHPFAALLEQLETGAPGAPASQSFRSIKVYELIEFRQVPTTFLRLAHTRN